MGTPSTTKSTFLPAQAYSDLLAVKGYPFGSGEVYYVDETNGADTNNGLDGWSNAKATIQAAITAASQGDTILIAPVEVAAGDTDPGSYSENLVIGTTQAYLSLIGVPRGRVQGGLPQLKVGATTTSPLLTIRAPGCTIRNLGFNGTGGTGGGIVFDETTANGQAWGTSIENCHFKNCVGTTATNAATGGAINWQSVGGAWQILVKGCRFYKNVGDIVMKGTTSSLPQDVVIEDCVFSGPAASVDCNIYVAADGINGVVVRNCSFQQKPAIGSGTNAKYIVMGTGTVGVIEGCKFGCQTSATGGTQITFKSGGTGGDFPTTVHIVASFGQSITDGESGEITIAA